MSDSYDSVLEDEQVLEEDEGVLDDAMEPFNPKEIEVATENKSLDALIERIRHDEIDMNTEFQRHADLWDNKKMSRLIESILIRFPLPAFYFDASNDDKWLVVDGLQRLSAIRKFVIDKKLKLRDLEFLKDLNGCSYDGLSRSYQRRIKECQVITFMIKPGTPEDVKYSIFRRINTGGLTLNNQEIRNAMAKKRERTLLEELANHPTMKFMLGDLSKRMIDQELVLRFWAFYRFDYLAKENKKEMALFLDNAMRDIAESNDAMIDDLKFIFDTAICRCAELLGEDGFEKDASSTKSNRKIKNSTLYEVWMVSLAKLTEEQVQVLRTKRMHFQMLTKQLFSEPDFFKAITYSTQKNDHVAIRYQKVNDLIQEALDA